MPPQLFSHPWVYSATKTDDKITLRVEVTDLHTTQGAIEITGEATQVNGAFAPIACITNIASAVEGDPNDPEEANRYFVEVDAVPTSDHEFNDREDVTVFVRVSKVWVTVIGPGTDEPQPPPGTGPRVKVSPTWGIHKADAHIRERTGSY
jgi:hypothetical protein